MTTSAATIYRWSDRPLEHPAPLIDRRFISAERLTVGHFELKRGGIVPKHAHENEQVSCVLSGVLTFRFPDREVIVRGGEVVRIPSWVEHEVEVVEDATIIDIFSPVRADWVDKA